MSRVFGKAEVVPMGKNLKARGPPEQWLAAVDKRLGEQLRRQTKDVIALLADIATPATTPKATAQSPRLIDSVPIQVHTNSLHSKPPCAFDVLTSPLSLNVHTT